MLYAPTRILAALALSVVMVAGAPKQAKAAGVPCRVFGTTGATNCPNPFMQGVVDYQWIGLVSLYTGTNADATEIIVFAIGVGGNGYSTIPLMRIDGGEDNGDRMSAHFIDNKLWIISQIYLPGQAHCCPTQEAVRQFGFHDRKLRVEVTVTAPLGSSDGVIRQALARGAHLY